MMAESPNGQKPTQSPWAEERHGEVRPSDASGHLTAADRDQTALLPDHSQEVQPASSGRAMRETRAVALEPLANSVAKTERIQLAPQVYDKHRSSANTWSVGTNECAVTVPVEAATRSPRFRILLLLLMLVLPGSVAIWTPEGLQAVAASAIARVRSPNVPETRTAPGPGPLVGQLDVISAPSGVELYVDGELHGVTPVQLVLHAGTHQLTFVSPVGRVSRKVRVLPGHRTLFSEAIFPGSLAISSETGVEVRIDGRSIGIPGSHALMIAPGSYRVDLVNPKNGARTTHTVEIFPGQVTTLAARAPRGN